MILKWEDTTSYSQGQRGKIAQTGWGTTVKGIRIWVSCAHLAYPGEWVVRSSVLDDGRPFTLGRKHELSSQHARNLAVHAVRSEVSETIAKMGGVLAVLDTVSDLPPAQGG